MKTATFTPWDASSGIDGRTCHIVIIDGKLAFGTIYREAGDPLTFKQQVQLLTMFDGIAGRVTFSEVIK